VIISPNPRLVTWYQRRSRLGFFRFFFSSHHLSFRPPSRSPLPPSRSSPPPSRPYRLRPHLRGSRPLPSRSGRRRHPDPSAAAVQISAAAAQIRPPLPRSVRRCRPDPAAAAVQIRPPPPPRSGRRRRPDPRRRCPDPAAARSLDCELVCAALVQICAAAHPPSRISSSSAVILADPGCCPFADLPFLAAAVHCCPPLVAVPAAPGRSSQQCCPLLSAAVRRACCAKAQFPAVLRQAAVPSSAAPGCSTICGSVAVNCTLPRRHLRRASVAAIAGRLINSASATKTFVNSSNSDCCQLRLLWFAWFPVSCSSCFSLNST
jgi:hypothetical protein